MEIQVRRATAQIQDQENNYAVKGKNNSALPAKRQGLPLRDTSNLQTLGKVAVAAAEFEKKAGLNRNVTRSNSYSHVQSKVDTGRAVKNAAAPSARPPLRREESTAALAARAARTKVSQKEAQLKPNEEKQVTIVAPQPKVKTERETRKSTRLPSVKESVKEKTLKPILKEPTDSLGKLKLIETAINVQSSLVNYETLEKLHLSPQLPKNIEDIDAQDKNCPLLMAVYIKDIYNYLTELEVKYSIEPDHLRNQSSITGNMRATLIDWLVEVQRQFSLMLETFHLTVGIVDRYLQCTPNVQRNRLQLVGVTAMFIASKYEEIYPPVVGDFVFVTDNAYSKADVFQCEREILSKLGFCLARPIPLSFLRRFIKAAHGASKNHHLAKYLVDLCLVEYTMCHYRPSELAAAAICLSLYLLSNSELEQIWNPTLSYYSGYTLEHIKPIITKIVTIVRNVENSRHKSVYNKYCDKSLAKVALLPQLKNEYLDALDF